jgi:hypothetical protein
MALGATVSYTTTGTMESLNLDPSIAPFNASVVATLGTTGTYKLQYSLDDPNVADADAIWTDSVNIPSGTTSSAVTNFMFPVSRIRVVIDALDSTLTLQFLQGYTSN